MDDLDRQLAARDRFKRSRASAMTYEQRLARMLELQETSRRLLRASPSGYARFLRRNYKARAIQLPDIAGDHAG